MDGKDEGVYVCCQRLRRVDEGVYVYLRGGGRYGRGRKRMSERKENGERVREKE